MMLLALLPTLSLSSPVHAQGDCEAGWVSTFGAMPDLDVDVHAMTVFDDGDGPALYVGGRFESVGGWIVNDIAKWDGAKWRPLGSGLVGPNNNAAYHVNALTTFDDGSGPVLIAAGNFIKAGGVSAVDIARWNGSAWSALGSGTNGVVNALATFDDGNGPALYAAGDFSTIGGVSAIDVARWNGSSWSALGSGTNGSVSALAFYDDGNGPALYATGQFTLAGGVAANSIAKWNGSAWSALGNGLQEDDGETLGAGIGGELVVFDDGGGAKLFAGGLFTHAGGQQAFDLAKWNGSSWSAAWNLTESLNQAPFSRIAALKVADDGLTLYATHIIDYVQDVSSLWRASGTQWTVLSEENQADAEDALCVFDDGAGPTLYVAGPNVRRWTGTALEPLANGLSRGVTALACFDDGLGSGATLYAGRENDHGHALPIERWNGTSWSIVPNGLAGVTALCVFDGGNGAELVVGGVQPLGTSGISRWNGTSWSATTTTNSYVTALAAFDDGSGPALFAGGSFTTIDGVPANHVARWDGASWTPLGTGLNGDVFALATFDDGTGAALYSAGSFTSAGGTAANRIAKWDGASWTPLGAGTSERVYALTTYDDGNGQALYAAGAFGTAGGVTVNFIARWDGQAWSALAGGGMSNAPNVLVLGPASVRALAVMDDGSGPALFAGGSFLRAGGVLSPNLAKWDGAHWYAAGNGTIPSTTANAPSQVLALAVGYEANGPALYVGGTFTGVPDSGDSYAARWQGCDETAPTIAHLPEVFAADSLLGPPGEIVTFAVTASDSQDPAPALVCVPPSGSFFDRGTTIVTCTATDGAGNQTVSQFPVHVVPKAGQRRR